MSIVKNMYLWIIFVVCVLDNPMNSEVMTITNENFNEVVASNELVLINFNTEWSKISKSFAPIYREASDLVAAAFPDNGSVVFGHVNCDEHIEFANRFNIRKYPTIIVVLNGEVRKAEYRGERTAYGLLRFVEATLEDPIMKYASIEDLGKSPFNRNKIIAFFEQRNQLEYQVYRKVATNFKKYCEFYVGYANMTAPWHPVAKTHIIFKEDIPFSSEHDETFMGSLKNIDELKIWVEKKCKYLVNEISFENINDFTADELPFMILFYHPNNLSTIHDYKQIIEEQFADEKDNISFVFANGQHFTHSLNLLTKFKTDLPIIAIDSRRHIFLFRCYTNIYVPNLLMEFLHDFYSGKLLMEFYYQRNGYDYSDLFQNILKDEP